MTTVRTHKRHLRPSIKRALEVVGYTVLTIAAIIGLGYMFIGGVMQESYRVSQPTAEELRENPKLEKYNKGDVRTAEEIRYSNHSKMFPESK